MSMDTQERICNICGYEVTHQDISDAHGPGVVQFVAIVKEGSLAGQPAVVCRCPNCEELLSLESTTSVPSSAA